MSIISLVDGRISLERDVEDEGGVCSRFLFCCEHITLGMEIEEDEYGMRPASCPRKDMHCGWFP